MPAVTTHSNHKARTPSSVRARRIGLRLTALLMAIDRLSREIGDGDDGSEMVQDALDLGSEMIVCTIDAMMAGQTIPREVALRMLRVA